MQAIRNLRLPFQTILLAAVILCVYYPTLFAPLNSIDDPGMYTSLLNAGPLSLDEIFLPGGSGTYYRPLLWLSFLFDKYVWGLEESFMHLNNILLHLGNALLVLTLARRASVLIGLRAGTLPLAAAVLFALHPLNTEAVNWISGRTDLLAGFFVLLSIWLLLFRPLSIGFTCLSAISLLLACLAKETAIFFLPAAITLPLFLDLRATSLFIDKAIFRKTLPHTVVLLSAGAGYFLLRNLALAKGDAVTSRAIAQVAALKAVSTQNAGSLLADGQFLFLTVVKTLGFYAKKLFLPFPLNFGILTVNNYYVIPGVLVCFLIAWWLFKRRTLVSYFFLSAVAVGSSALVVPFLNVTWTPVAERYMYIPSAFFLLGLTLSLGQADCSLRCQRWTTLAVAIIALVAFSGTLSRNFVWQDNLLLLQDTLRQSPGFVRLRNDIAIELNNRGRYQEALEIYQTFDARAGSTGDQNILVNKANALARAGDYAQARSTLVEILKNPGTKEVLILEKMLEVNKLEVMHGENTSAGLYDDNVLRLSRLNQLTGNPFYVYRLGVIHLHVQNFAEALAAFTEVCRTAPQDVYYRKPAEKQVVNLTKQLKKSEEGDAQQ